MKKSIFLMALLIVSQMAFASPNYKNGNGTIVSVSEKNGVKTTVRKCVIGNVKIGDLLEEENRNIYADYSSSKIVGKLKDNDEVKVLEVLTIEYLNKPKTKWGETAGELWYKIQLNNLKGCICVRHDGVGPDSDPYYENRYEILEEIRTSKKWTVRKLCQTVSVWKEVAVRVKPGFSEKVVYTLHDSSKESRSPQENYEILAITEETETVNGATDHWLKVEYAPNKFGWIFGGDVSVERGGPRYNLPESVVLFELSWY